MTYTTIFNILLVLLNIPAAIWSGYELKRKSSGRGLNGFVLGSSLNAVVGILYEMVK